MGQYYPVDSRVHRLDPRMKLVLTIAFIVAVFMAHSFAGYALLLAFLYFVCRMANVPFRMLLKGLRPLRMIIILTFLLNLFFTPGETLWVSVWIIRIYKEGFLQALFYSLRLIFLVAGTSLLTLTTSPIALSDGIEMLLAPLKKIHFPVHELAMMMTIALRFIPTLLEETDRIIKAQTSRGADFQSGNILQKAKNMLPILIPLFISAFRRADDLAVAMEARCYRGGEGRTRMHQLAYRGGDAAAFVFGIAMIVFLVLLRWGPLAAKL